MGQANVVFFQLGCLFNFTNNVSFWPFWDYSYGVLLQPIVPFVNGQGYQKVW